MGFENYVAFTCDFLDFCIRLSKKKKFAMNIRRNKSKKLLLF